MALVLAVTAVVFVLWGTAHPTAAAPSGGGDDAGGDSLYGRDCAGCHGPEGEGSPRGIALTDSGEAAAHYMLTTGRMPIEEPDDPIRRGAPKYSQSQIDALVGHVGDLGDGPDLPDVDPADGDVARGGELYRLHCGQCHGATGLGGVLAFDRFAPVLTESEPSVVAAAVTTGPGAMPSFTGLDFSDDELASVVAYVQDLQTPVDAGGAPVSLFGRVSEGLFVWAVVVPSVVLLAAWLARRAR